MSFLKVRTDDPKKVINKLISKSNQIKSYKQNKKQIRNSLIKKVINISGENTLVFKRSNESIYTVFNAKNEFKIQSRNLLKLKKIMKNVHHFINIILVKNANTTSFVWFSDGKSLTFTMIFLKA